MPAFPAPRTSDTDIWRILAYLKAIAASAPASASAGNAGAGQSLFAANCVGCHRVGESGGRIGPDLSRIGVSRARAAMARQIRGNVGDFRTGYAPVTLTTPDGEEISGVKKNEDMFSVQIMDNRERIQGYLREDMKSVTDGRQSAMPAFGPDKLTDAQLDDLLAYLETLQGAAAPAATGNR
jgi:putative heme-binding domain-containing protein